MYLEKLKDLDIKEHACYYSNDDNLMFITIYISKDYLKDNMKLKNFLNNNEVINKYKL